MNYIRLLIFIICTVINISSIASPALAGPAAHLITFKNNHNSTEVYIKNYAGQNVLLYKADFLYSDSDGVAAEQQGDTVFILLSCTDGQPCSRLFNRKTNQLSAIKMGLLAYTTKQKLAAYYLEDKHLIVIEPVFANCKKPLTYPFTLAPDLSFNFDTYFLANGDFQLQYGVPDTVGYFTKIIPVDYATLLKDCEND